MKNTGRSLFSRAARAVCLSLALGVSWLALSALQPERAVAQDSPSGGLPVEEITSPTPIDFQQEILPILQKNCLACHNRTKAESLLNLETPASMIKGGSGGEAIIPGKPEDSLVFLAAAHISDPVMPPKVNAAGAKPLGPRELGILKLWITQGAKGEVTGAGPIAWQPLPPGVNPIYAVDISADGQYAACGRANQVFIYHLATGKLVGKLTDPKFLADGTYARPGVAHLDLVQAITFDQSGDLLATSGFQEVKIWRRSAGTQRHLLAGPSPAKTVAASADGKWVATGFADGSIQLFNLEAGAAGPTLAGHTAAIDDLEFSADSQYLVSASQDKTVRLWNTSDGTARGHMELPLAATAVTVLRGGASLATASAENMVRIWKAPAAIPADLPLEETTLVSAATTDGKMLALADAAGKIRLVDAATGATLKTLAGHSGPVHSLCFDTSGQKLASASADQSTLIWDVASGMVITQLLGEPQPVRAVAMQPQGTRAVVGWENGFQSVFKLDVAAGRLLAGKDGQAVRASATSSDGTKLATAGVQDGKPALFIRDLASGQITQTLLGHEGPVTAVAFSRDGSKLVSGSADKTIRVWQIAEQKEIGKVANLPANVTAVGLLGDAQVVAATQDNAIKLWNLADGLELRAFAGAAAPVVQLGITPDNQAIFAASDTAVRVWNANDASLLRTIAFDAPVVAMATSWNFDRIAISGNNKKTRVYQFADGVLQQELPDAALDINGLGFNADGTRLAVSYNGPRSMVWDLTNKRIAQVLPAASSLSFAAFTNAVDQLVVGLQDETASVVTLAFDRFILGVETPLADIAYRPDGNTVLVAHKDGVLRSINVPDGAERFRVGNGSPVNDLAVSPDGAWFATASETADIRIWNADNGGGGPKPQLAGFTGPVLKVAFLADGQRVAGGTAAGEVQVFHLADGLSEQVDRRSTTPIAGFVPGANPQEPGLQILAQDKLIKAMPVLAVRRITGHGQPYTSLACIPNSDSQFLASAEDGIIMHFTDEGQQVRTVNHGAPVADVAVRPDGQQFATAGRNGVSKLWNLQNGQQLVELRGDIRAQRLLASQDAELKLTTANLDRLTQAVDAADKDIVAKDTAAQAATTALTAAQTDLTAKQAAADKAAADKAAVDKMLADLASQAAKATAELETAQKLATETATQLQMATEAKTAADQLAALSMQAAQTAEQGRVTSEALATTAATELTALEEQLKAIRKVAAADADAKPLAEAMLAAEKLVKDGMRIAQTNFQRQTQIAQARLAVATAAADRAKRLTTLMETANQMATEAAAKIKPLTDAKTTLDAQVAQVKTQVETLTKPAQESAAALQTALAAKNKAASEMELAAKGLTAAQALSPMLKTELAAAQTLKTQLEEQVKANTTLVQMSEKPAAAICYSADGRVLAVAGEDRLVHTYAAEGGNAMEVFPGHEGTILGLAFTPGGDLISAGDDQKSIVWNAVPIWNLERTLDAAAGATFADRVVALDFSHDGKLLATGGGEPSRSGEVKVFTMATGELFKEFPQAHSDAVFGVAFSRDGRLLASCSADKFVRVLDMQSGEIVRSMEGHTNHVLAVGWRSDGQVLASCGADNVIKVWQYDTGEQQRTITGFNKQVTSLRFAGDTTDVITGGGDGSVRLTRTENGQNLRGYGGFSDFVYAAAISDKQDVVVAGGQDSILRVWNGQNSQLMFEFAPPKEDQVVGK